ncbi:hypothetical protein CP532_0680 [Ophiocordyceps camponoti-leonardi (nom. inval.)]|nr:hypothetical protein CP532_0680 [Ophiocordyceps camponoti-leonardi (nom. inval.)]
MLKLSKLQRTTSGLASIGNRRYDYRFPHIRYQSHSSKTRTDQAAVVPLRFFDNTPLTRSIIVRIMFVFDDVLDPGKLHDSLRAVVERDGWRRLGARLSRDESGELEERIPFRFDAHRPAIKFSHIDHRTIRVKDHPLGKKLPKPSSRVAVVGKQDEFVTLAYSTDSPRSLQGYIDSQEAQLGLRVVSFSDTTLVSVQWPHALMDGMGGAALLRAWTLALQGRHDEIPNPVSDDPLAELGKHPTEEHKLSKQHMSSFDLLCYGLRNLRQIVFPNSERRIICVPASFIASLRHDSLLKLKADHPAGKKEDLFISEGDILCAWWTRLYTTVVTQAAVGKSSRTIAFRNIIALQKVLSTTTSLGSGRPYLGNAWQPIDVLFKAADLSKQPLHSIAYQIRQSIKELSSRGQVEAFTKLWRVSPFKLIPSFGDSGILTIPCSNWTKLGFFDADFSAAIPDRTTSSTAVRHRPDPPHSSRRGKPSFVDFGLTGLEKSMGAEALILPNAVCIMGKDADGNYWLDIGAGRNEWGKIEEMLANATIRPRPTCFSLFH